MSSALEMDDEEYVDVRSLPLRPPQPLVRPTAAARRPWHPVMWDHTIAGEPAPSTTEEDQPKPVSREYPHKQRIRNLRRLIAEGKVKPTSETLIFFLCNKFAVSDDHRGSVERY